MATKIVAGVRAALYLRKSEPSPERQETSIEDQRTELAKYADRNGYPVVVEYTDEISGDATERRTGFLAMRDAAAAGEFEVVLAWDQDRFGRFDPLDAGYWIYPFRRSGVRLETVAQGKIDWEDLTGQLVYSVNQLGKAQFLRDLSRNTTRGILAAARKGTAGTGGPNPYGYRSKDGEVRVVEGEAAVVRFIFREYIKAGSSLRSIAAELNRRGIAPPCKARGIRKGSGKVWRCSSVAIILRRRKYTGTFVYGERNGGSYFAMRDGEIVPRRKVDKFVRSTPIIHQDKFEAIIDQDTFDQAQAKLKTGASRTAPRTARPYLLAGLVKCGDCKGSMGGLRPKRPVYRCRLYHQTGTAVCFCNTIPEAPLVEAVRRKINERYLSEAALARLRRSLEAEQDQSAPKPRDLSRLRREIEVLDRKIDNAETAVLDAPQNSRGGLYRKLEELNTERDRLKADLTALASRQTTPERRDGSEIDQAIEALRTLGEALRKATPDDTKTLLSTLVVKIELHFNHGETDGGRKTSEFSHGFIHVRPDTGAGSLSDPNSTRLNNKRSFVGQECTVLRFTAADLRRAA
jgi:site-specific DNA recombinase